MHKLIIKGPLDRGPQRIPTMHGPCYPRLHAPRNMTAVELQRFFEECGEVVNVKLYRERVPCLQMIRGIGLSNTTCLTQAFFKSGE